MKRFRNLGLSLLSGLLLSSSWPTSGITSCIFVGFVPLMLLVQYTPKRAVFFAYCLLSMFLWNVGTTWWIWNSTSIGSIAAMLANSLLMCLPCLLYHYCIHRFANKYAIAYSSWIVCWMLFEYVHLNWELSWPWLTLGNVFAASTTWIQWYEYTGVAGGTLWVLVANVMVFTCWKAVQRSMNKGIILRIGTIALWLGLPICISKWMLHNHYQETQAATQKVCIVQPNIDPYQKFEANTIANQINTLLSLSASADSSTTLLVWPETAMNAYDEQQNIEQNSYYFPVMQFLQQHPRITLLSGIEMYKNYGTNAATTTARKASNGMYFDALNAAVALQFNQPPQFYIKSKLVPGVEHLPTFFNFLAPVFEQFGGTTGGYGMDTAAHNFSIPAAQSRVAPIICYESIYGAYVAEYVKKGAHLLSIVTNDGWWGNTPGHRQHLAYAQLRAIENRRWIVRSANTGISAVIDAYGQVQATIPWNEASILHASVPMVKKLTLYTLWGDYLYQLAAILSVVCVVVMVLLNRKLVKR